jgi:hypothetical protein
MFSYTIINQHHNFHVHYQVSRGRTSTLIYVLIPLFWTRRVGISTIFTPRFSRKKWKNKTLVHKIFMHFHANDSNLCQFHWKINCPHLNIVITISTFGLYFVVYTVRYTANSALWFTNFFIFPFFANWTTHELGSEIHFLYMLLP